MIYGEFALLTIYAFSFTRYFSIFGLKITKKIGFERTLDKKKKKKKGKEENRAEWQARSEKKKK